MHTQTIVFFYSVRARILTVLRLLNGTFSALDIRRLRHLLEHRASLTSLVFLLAFLENGFCRSGRSWRSCNLQSIHGGGLLLGVSEPLLHSALHSWTELFEQRSEASIDNLRGGAGEGILFPGVVRRRVPPSVAQAIFTQPCHHKSCQRSALLTESL